MAAGTHTDDLTDQQDIDLFWMQLKVEGPCPHCDAPYARTYWADHDSDCPKYQEGRERQRQREKSLGVAYTPDK